MERLTERNKNGLAMAACCGKACEYNYCCEVGGFSDCKGIDDIIDRLADIEDVLCDEYDLDRMRELVEADKAGRLYKFRFGVGSTVYRVWVRPDGTHPFISEDKIECLRDMMRAELWVEPYSTREEAEAALEKMQGATHE